MATFQLLSFGCRASQADGAAIKKQLLDSGLKEVEDIAASQVAILNTCTVTARADAEVRQLLRRIHRANPRCRILVTGCYAQRSPAEITQLEGVAWVVGNSHKHVIADLLRPGLKAGPQESGVSRQEPEEVGRTQLVQIQQEGSAAAASGETADHNLVPEAALPLSHPPAVLVGAITDEFHFAPVFPDDRTRPTLKIQDGCNARCSFCVIPSVRGRSRSLAPERVVAQVRELGREGTRKSFFPGSTWEAMGGTSTGALLSSVFSKGCWRRLTSHACASARLSRWTSARRSSAWWPTSHAWRSISTSRYRAGATGFSVS